MSLNDTYKGKIVEAISGGRIAFTDGSWIEFRGKDFGEPIMTPDNFNALCAYAAIEVGTEAKDALRKELQNRGLLKEVAPK